MGFQKGHKYGVRFQPGRSGNPAGRPKSKTLSEALRLALGETGDKKLDQTNAELIAQAIVKKALKGDVRAFLAIADQTEGKPKQRVELDGQVDLSLEVSVTRIMELSGCDRPTAIRALAARIPAARELEEEEAESLM